MLYQDIKEKKTHQNN